MNELGHLIDRQVSRWETTKRLPVEDRSVHERVSQLPEGPWIAISTQLGAGGAALAASLGERLGWRVFDKQIVEEIAKSTHSKERSLSLLDGHPMGAFEDYVTHLFLPRYPGRPAYVLETMRVVWEIGRRGKAIMVGRGSNWLLDPHYGLRLRVVAPVEARMEWLIRTQRATLSDARRRIEQDNTDRAKFVRQVFKQDIDDPLGYDLTLNVGELGIGTSADVVMMALASKLKTAAARVGAGTRT